jgi:hypothetical protein
VVGWSGDGVGAFWGVFLWEMDDKECLMRRCVWGGGMEWC